MHLGSIVKAQREKTQQEKLYLANIYSRKILKKLKSMPRGVVAPDLEERLDEWARKYNLGEDYTITWIQCIFKELGDPRLLYENSLKQHCSPYWNPTAHRIRIEALGIISGFKDGQVAIQDYVEPGEQVMIPWSMTAGGKRSALKGVAPQLIPLRVQDQTEEHDLEISPLTFNEWCAFCSAHRLSPCCGKQVLWNVKSNKLVCQRCNARIQT